VVVGDELRLYYFGKVGVEERLYLATTSDLKTFTKYEKNPIFTVRDAQLDGERVFPNPAVKDGDKWYHFCDIGFDYRHPQHPRTYVICVALSKDGIHVKDADRNPIISSGLAGAWDDAMVCQANVMKSMIGAT
jgi:predicted GH43/DUF377 family glycosyl hydrolase